jgi:hypothetical protein
MLAAAAALLAGVAGAGPAAAADRVVDTVAASIQAHHGDELMPGVSLVSARADDRTLVVVLSIAPNMRALVSPSLATAIMAGGLCRSGDINFFADGRAVRVDMSVADGVAAGAVMDRCPTPAELEPSVAGFASVLQQQVGQNFQGMTLSAVRAEESNLVITVNGPPGWRAGQGMATMLGYFLSGFCADMTWPYFNHGRTLQLETLESGRNPLRSAVAEHCPA